MTCRSVFINAHLRQVTAIAKALSPGSICRFAPSDNYSGYEGYDRIGDDIIDQDESPNFDNPRIRRIAFIRSELHDKN